MAASPPPVLWTPSQLPAVKGWYKADIIGGCDNGSPISSWVDCSGNGNHGTNSGNNPDLSTAALNGLNVVQFTAANSDAFDLPSGMVSAFTEGSAFFVAKANSETVFSGPPVGSFGTSGIGEAYAYVDGHAYVGFLSTTRPDLGDPGAISTWHIGSFQSKTSDYRAAFNGVDYYTNTSNVVGAQTGAVHLGVSGNYFDGQIAEVIICNSFLTTTDRQNVEGYLAWKWGLQASLPVGHPWVDSPPPASLTFTTAFSMTADAGTFTFTGQSAALEQGYDLPAANATFTYSGQAALLERGYVMAAAQATFSYAGQAALLERGYNLVAGQTTFSYTGQAAILALGRALAAAAGSFGYSGQAVNLVRSIVSQASSGAFTYSGQIALLTLARILTAGPGTYSYTGFAAAASLALSHGAAVFTYVGQDAELRVVIIASGLIMTFDGLTFVPREIKAWNGAAWVTRPLKVWNGSAWLSS